MLGDEEGGGGGGGVVGEDSFGWGGGGGGIETCIEASVVFRVPRERSRVWRCVRAIGGRRNRRRQVCTVEHMTKCRRSVSGDRFKITVFQSS